MQTGRRMHLVMVGTLPWSDTKPMRRKRSGDVFDHAPMFLERNGHRTFGFSRELLRSCMDDVGGTYRDLQAASGVSRIAHIARGERQPDESQVVALARALGIEPWQLCWALSP